MPPEIFSTSAPDYSCKAPNLWLANSPPEISCIFAPSYVKQMKENNFETNSSINSKDFPTMETEIKVDLVKEKDEWKIASADVFMVQLMGMDEFMAAFEDLCSDLDGE